jgi:hypothetical protein
LQAEQQARQKSNAALIKQLEVDAGAWHRACYLRRYIRAARRRIGDGRIDARYLNESLDYLAWGDRYVDQLDPLTPTPRGGDFERPSNEYGPTEASWKDGRARLVGGQWKDAWKLGKVFAKPPEKRPGDYIYYGREKSVFEVKLPSVTITDDE